MDDLPAAVDLAAYRIVQEALTNASRHAPGSRVAVNIARSEEALMVEVVNPLGVRRNESVGTGSGLTGMRERATSLGGSFSAGAADQQFIVHAVLPLRRVS